MGYKDIRDFTQQHDSIRDLFIAESEEIFTHDDKSWLEYIKKHKHNGHDVKLYNAEGKVLSVVVKCIPSKNKDNIDIVELEDVSRLEFAKSQINEVEELLLHQ